MNQVTNNPLSPVTSTKLFFLHMLCLSEVSKEVVLLVITWRLKVTEAPS